MWQPQVSLVQARSRSAASQARLINAAEGFPDEVAAAQGPITVHGQDVFARTAGAAPAGVARVVDGEQRVDGRELLEIAAS